MEISSKGIDLRISKVGNRWIDQCIDKWLNRRKMRTNLKCTYVFCDYKMLLNIKHITLVNSISKNEER